MINFLKCCFCILSYILAINTFAKTPTSEEEDRNPRPIRIELRHIENKGVGYNTGYTTLEAFLAPSGNRWHVTPFLDLRGHVFDNGKFASNAGIGLRLLSNCRVYGFNAYYDYRNTKEQHYNQVSFGFETMGVRWDFRLNGYLPVGNKTSHPYDIHNSITHPSFDSFVENLAFIRQTATKKNKVEFAMAGVDAETAYHILNHKNIDLYAAGGPYYYNYKNRKAIGGKVRLFAQVYKYLSLELINSYDSRFHENIQGSIGINIPLGTKFKISKNKKFKNCKDSYFLAQRLFQDVKKQEIIVVDHFNQKTVTDVVSLAINPLTGEPYYFIFVDNTSSSLGTYKSPYPTFALAEEHSKPGDIIYVFPGDGTTKGMNSGIALQADQKFWGSGVNQLLLTSKGAVSIPPQSSSSPTITNNNIDTELNAITLATNNAVSGFIIASTSNDAIYGTNCQNLEVSSCIFENTSTYAIEASFFDNASISLINNQLLDNTNGIKLTLKGPTSLICSNNTFQGQTSPSETPLEINADSNTLNCAIENNIFNNNETGSILFNFTNVIDARINVINNTITNNNNGGQGFASSVAILPTGTSGNCSIVLKKNSFSNNTLGSFYMNNSGRFTNFEMTASENTMSNNGNSALYFGTACTNFTLNATNNKITALNDAGISIGSDTPFQTSNITINNNTITDIGNSQSAISLNVGMQTLNFIAENNTINRCAGSGFLFYANVSEFTNMNTNIIGNTISNCQNVNTNAGSGISISIYTNLVSTIANNTFSNNATSDVGIGIFTSGNPNVCLTLTGNSSTTDPGYVLVNPGSGAFNLSPCNANSLNSGSINATGVTYIKSCPGGAPCN